MAACPSLVKMVKALRQVMEDILPVESEGTDLDLGNSHGDLWGLQG